MNPQLRSVIADTLGIDEQFVQPSLARDAEECWDSLNHLRLVTAVEETFHIKLSMTEIQHVTTAAQLETCINEHATTE